MFVYGRVYVLPSHSLSHSASVYARSGDPPVIANRPPALAMCVVVVLVAIAYFIFSIGCALIAI